MGGPGNPSAPIDVNAFRTINFRSRSAMRDAEIHGNTRRDSTTRILSIDTDGQIYMYADDTLIVCKSNDIDVVTSKVQNTLNRMVSWCTASKLSINIEEKKQNTSLLNIPNQITSPLSMSITQL